MENQELKNRILNVLSETKVGSLSTVKNNKPHSRYMTFYHEGLTLHTATSKDTYKVEEIEKNPFVHILIGYEGDGMGDAYLEIQGKAVIREDQALKDKYFNEKMKKWIKSSTDPDYIILEITPDLIRLMNDDGNPDTLTL